MSEPWLDLVWDMETNYILTRIESEHLDWILFINLLGVLIVLSFKDKLYLEIYSTMNFFN